MTQEERIEVLEKKVEMLTEQLKLTINVMSRITTAVNYNSAALIEIHKAFKGDDEIDPDARIRA